MGKQSRLVAGLAFKVNERPLCLQDDEYRDSVTIAKDMEDHYGHYFDSVIPFDDVDYVFDQLIYEIGLLEREPQWVPAKWVKGLNATSNSTS